MILIGLSGGAGVGKTHLINHYLRKWGYYDAPLADELKVRAVAQGVASYEDAFFHKPPSVRKWLQEEGTERGRDVYGENIWCNTLLTRLRRAAATWGLQRFVVSDVRFPNEVNFVLDNGGIVLRIEAPQRYALNGMSEEARQHRSERALDDFPVQRYTGLLFNDPEYADSVEWQLRTHLENQGYPTEGDLHGVPPNAAELRRLMFPPKA
jgi:hypothetical protein